MRTIAQRYRARRSALLAAGFVALFLIWIPAWSGDGATSYRGSIEKLVSLMIAKGKRDTPSDFHFELENKSEKIRLYIKVYYSSDKSFDMHDNRCTATIENNEIYCDLRMVDGVLAYFDISNGKHSAIKSTASRTEKNSAHVALKWIVAHEVGHIVKKHGLSDYADPPDGMLVYNNEQQRKELDADQFSIELIGNITQAPTQDYQYIMHSTNALIRRALCPSTYPETCAAVNPGVGLIYNSASFDLINIGSGGDHPDYVARFVRILYLSGLGTNDNSLSYLAKQVISKFSIQNQRGEFRPIKEVMDTTTIQSRPTQ